MMIELPTPNRFLLPSKRLFQFVFFVVISTFCGLIQAQDQSVDLETHYDLIYQIKVIEDASDSKTAIGSGFQISDDGLVVTNYHVISGYINSPDSFHINYLDQNQQEGPLEVITFDVVNDLALLRRADPTPEFLPLAQAELSKGDTIFALGNPRDVGITLVAGIFNGLSELNYNPNIIFSGSLNGGMSGGPALNTLGEVIGVNVATAGSQLSFLIPVDRINPMLARANSPLDPKDYDKEIVAQLSAYQNERIGDLIERDWPTTPLGSGMALSEIRSDMRCWGRSNERDTEDLYSVFILGCNSADNIYLSSRLDTGQIHYSFASKSSEGLGDYRFHRYLSDNGLNADNQATRNDVTDYQCSEEYIDPEEFSDADTQNLAILCVRSYKKLVGLYDVLFFAAVTEDLESLTAHFTLAGVDQPLAEQFTEKFMRHIQWN